MPEVPGVPVHIEGTSADASSGLDLSGAIYEAGTKTALSGTGRVLMVSDLTIISKSGGTCTLQSRTATSTLTLFGGVLAANGGVSRPFRIPAMGLRGGSLVLTSDAGVIHIQAEGTLVY